MATILQDLQTAGFLVDSALDTGKIVLTSGYTIPMERKQEFADIVSFHVDPVAYAKRKRIEARKAVAVNEAKLATELRTLTATEAVAYVENNVTTLATAKTVIKIMVRLLIALRDETWPDLPE